MYQIIVKDNGKRAVVEFMAGDESPTIIRNLRYAVGECMRVEKMTTYALAAAVDSQANLIMRFLRADPEMNGELPKR